jgi:beta-glucosidase
MPRRRVLGIRTIVTLALAATGSAACGGGSYEGSNAGTPGGSTGSAVVTSETPSGSGSLSSPGSGSAGSAGAGTGVTTSGAASAGGSSGSSGLGTNMCAAEAASIVNTIDDAIALMHGQPSNCPGQANVNNIFTTPGIPGVARGIFFRDGPRGVCLVANLPPGKSGYSTVFPSASSRGATFDVDLEKTIGEDMGDEMVAASHTLILAPVINILRHPAWGRSQETYGEDSYLLGRMGAAFVQGVQEYVPACAKHFAAYDIENGRHSNTSQMDEQTLHEIYGRHFEMVIQDANVACIMASHNLVQSTDGPYNTAYWSTESHELLTDMLRTTFGFQGFVISDWWALPGDNAACSAQPATMAQSSTLAINAGLDMEMPWYDNFTQLQNDLQGNTITPQEITTAATYIAKTQCDFKILDPNDTTGLKSATTTQDPASFNIQGNDQHIQDARQAATEGMVLLKNGLVNGALALPIPSTVKTLAVVGATIPFSLTNTDVSNGTVDFITSAITGDTLEATDLTGDFGSSRVYADPAKFTGPFAGLTNGAPAAMTVIKGGSTPANLVTTADFYVVMAGLTPEDEGEDYTGASDRLSFSLDDKLVHVENGTPVQNPLIQAVAALGKPMVVVLEGGSVIDMPWLASVPAVVMAWYPGQDGGDALADLLFGKVNFSGKLPVTWPNAIGGTCTTNPSSCNTTGPCPSCFGDEPLFTVGSARATPMGYYLGYRYYDQMGLTPLFALGYGLSYTTFTYGTPTLSATTASVGQTVNVTVPVTNAGMVAGDEVSFVFVSYPNTKRTGHSNVKELKGFVRTHMPVGTTPVQVSIPLRVSDLKYWDTPTSKWVYEQGPINVLVGGSSGSLQTPVALTLQ